MTQGSNQPAAGDWVPPELEADTRSSPAGDWIPNIPTVLRGPEPGESDASGRHTQGIGRRPGLPRQAPSTSSVAPVSAVLVLTCTPSAARRRRVRSEACRAASLGARRAGRRAALRTGAVDDPRSDRFTRIGASSRARFATITRERGGVGADDRKTDAGAAASRAADDEQRPSHRASPTALSPTRTSSTRCWSMTWLTCAKSSSASGAVRATTRGQQVVDPLGKAVEEAFEAVASGVLQARGIAGKS